MCGNPFKPPEIPALPAPAKQAEVLKNVSNDPAVLRDRTLKKMAARASIAGTNATAGALGSTSAATTQPNQLLGS